MAVSVNCDLRYLFGPARDQGDRPTCLAFASSDAHAAARSNCEPLSCEYAYYYAIQHDGSTPDDGATLQGMLTAIEKDGQPREEGWPYLATLPSDLSLWKPPLHVGPLFYHASDQKPVAELYAILGRGFPAILAITISDAFYTPDNNGIISGNEPIDPTRRHAVIAVGYGNQGNDRVILIRNSWGEFWGCSGYAWIDELYLMPRLISLVIMQETT
jgi:C1A family cysteine protease